MLIQRWARSFVGGACDRSFFSPQAEHFARRHRVISVDLRGHGESEKPPGSYPIAAYADDIAYIIEQRAMGKAVAVGHAWVAWSCDSYQRHAGGGGERYHWTVTVVGEPAPVAAGRTGEPAEARSHAEKALHAYAEHGGLASYRRGAIG